MSKESFSSKGLRVLALVVCVTPSALPQSTKTPAAGADPPPRDLTLERSSLLADLQSLEKETLRFGDPLSEASAKIEIADAAWGLDHNWAKRLIRTAYQTSLPSTDRRDAQEGSADSFPFLLVGEERSRRKVRLRALQVARRDKEFADELLQMEADSLGAYGKHFAAAALADNAVWEGDVNAAAEYILLGIKADPTHGTAPIVINQVAVLDRALADRLTIQYISELRRFPISTKDRIDRRIFSTLFDLVNATFAPDPSLKIPPPGPEVLRAYVGYILEALKRLEGQEPGYLRRRRPTLLSLWVPLQQHAPELAAEFLSLEGRSRRPGDNSPLPTASSVEEETRLRYERSVERGLESDRPDEGPIYSAAAHGDFDKARRMIAKLPEGAQKKQLLETVDAEEAAALAAKGDVYAAEGLAKELKRAASVVRVYAVLIGKSVANKDKPRATRLAYQALRQLKDSDNAPPAVPAGIPVSAVEGDKRLDPVLSSAARLASDVSTHDAELAFIILEELVAMANVAPPETERARIGFDFDVFKKLAPKNETRARQAAGSLKNPVRRVLALSAVYQWKVQELTKAEASSRELPARINPKF